MVAPTIYLHILWDRNDPRRLFLYGGQTQSLCRRIEQHSDPPYREHRPSLHYFMLDTGNLDSAFVVLAYCPITDSQTQGFIKNLLEAWNCLLLQALPQELLLKYLPLGIKIFGIVGLTIAYPLHQSFVDNDGEESQADFSQFEFSLD